MLNALIDFATELFPSISPYTKEKVKEAIHQFEHMQGTYKFCLPTPINFLSQGDVISNLPFARYNSDGQLGVIRTNGILLSNTCDAERDNALLVAPLIPLSGLPSGQHFDIKKNIIFRFLHIPDADLQDQVIDFSLASTIPRHLIQKGIEGRQFEKITSLNAYGYYLFLIKLTVYLQRPEDTDVQTDRRQDI